VIAADSDAADAARSTVLMGAGRQLKRGSSEAPHPGRATIAASAASAIQAMAMSRAGPTDEV
jgi:hypothetical protein